MSHEDIEKLARRRAAAKLGWYVHAGIYLTVNLLLATLSFASGRHWAIFPFLGWGLGLAIHGVLVFIVAGGDLHDRLVARERQRLQLQRDPW